MADGIGLNTTGDRPADLVRAASNRRYDRFAVWVGLVGAVVMALAGHPEVGFLASLGTYWGWSNRA